MKRVQLVCFMFFHLLWIENSYLYGLNYNCNHTIQKVEILEEKIKNFDLSVDEYNTLLASLKSGDNTLFKNIFLSHAEDCINFLQIKYNATRDDGYDAMVDTMIEFRQRLVDEKVTYGNMRFLFLQMATQHYVRTMKSNNKVINFDQSHTNLNDEEPTSTYDDAQLLSLEKAWTNLNDKCRELLKMNYYEGMKLNEIASKIDKAPDAVRKQKERCKESLIQLYNQAAI